MAWCKIDNYHRKAAIQFESVVLVWNWQQKEVLHRKNIIMMILITYAWFLADEDLGSLAYLCKSSAMSIIHWFQDTSWWRLKLSFHLGVCYSSLQYWILLLLDWSYWLKSFLLVCESLSYEGLPGTCVRVCVCVCECVCVLIAGRSTDKIMDIHL